MALLIEGLDSDKDLERMTADVGGAGRTWISGPIILVFVVIGLMGMLKRLLFLSSSAPPKSPWSTLWLLRADDMAANAAECTKFREKIDKDRKILIRYFPLNYCSSYKCTRLICLTFNILFGFLVRFTRCCNANLLFLLCLGDSDSFFLLSHLLSLCGLVLRDLQWSFDRLGKNRWLLFRSFMFFRCVMVRLAVRIRIIDRLLAFNRFWVYVSLRNINILLQVK